MQRVMTRGQLSWIEIFGYPCLCMHYQDSGAWLHSIRLKLPIEYIHRFVRLQQRSMLSDCWVHTPLGLAKLVHRALGFLVPSATPKLALQPSRQLFIGYARVFRLIRSRSSRLCPSRRRMRLSRHRTLSSLATRNSFTNAQH